MELLADTIGIEIVVEDTEVSVGSFNADIYATEADTGKRIVIENQLEQTDHDHLGKIITYAAGKDASYIVWVVKQARPEHKAAIEWLNAHTDSDVGFFLCELKLYQIGSSDIAPQFVAVEAPNDWSKAAKASSSSSGASASTKQFRYEYWATFNDHAFQDKGFAAAFKPHKPGGNWCSIYRFTGKGCEIILKKIPKRQSVAVALFISDDKAMYDRLEQRKTDIEAAIGYETTWERMDDRKASRIQVEKTFKSDDASREWDEEFSWLMEMALKFKETFYKFI